MFARTDSTIRVVIADDHTIVRRGLVSIINDEPDIVIVGEYANGLEALEHYDELTPDVVLMDLAMPILNGTSSMAKILEKDSQAKVIILTTYDEEEDVYRAMSAGACGYLLKDAAPAELISSIRRVLTGRKAIAPEAASMLAQRMGSLELTDRELEVLRLLAAGDGNKQICTKLSIAPGTVKAHIANLFAKLGAQGRTEAVAIALRRGLVRIER